MHAANGKRQIHNEINITPLTDVFLVLLIIMMLLQTSATLRYAGQIRPPQVEGADRIKQAEENCIIELTGKGPNGEPEQLSLDKAEMPVPQGDAKPPFIEALKGKAMASGKAKLLLRADKDASSDAVLSVIDAIQEAASDETLSTTSRTFLGTVTISVETLGNTAAPEASKPEEASVPAPAPVTAS